VRKEEYGGSELRSQGQGSWKRGIGYGCFASREEDHHALLREDGKRKSWEAPKDSQRKTGKMGTVAISQRRRVHSGNAALEGATGVSGGGERSVVIGLFHPFPAARAGEGLVKREHFDAPRVLEREGGMGMSSDGRGRCTTIDCDEKSSGG